MSFKVKDRKGKALIPMCLLALFLMLFISIGVNSAPQQNIGALNAQDFTSINHPYISPVPGELPIIASSPWVDGRRVSKSALQDVKDCGFNCVLSYTTLSYFNSVSHLLHDVGLKAIVGFPQFATADGIRIIDTLKNNPVIGAWRLVDEPREIDFGKWRDLYDNMIRVDSLHMPYINLIGPEAKQYFLGDCADYNAFMDKFQSMFHPGLWSYDVYPISEKNGKIEVNYPIFYEALEVYAGMAAITGRPFWAYCQSMGFFNKSLKRPDANLATLSFEAFSALGYGAKGLVYWTYCQRVSNERETYTSALLNLDGVKTPAWYAAQQINREISVLSDVFYNSAHVATYHTGKFVPEFCKRLSPALECIRSFSGGDPGFQVSLCKSGDSNYIIIVNKDVVSSQKLAMSFLGGFDIEMIGADLSQPGGKVSTKKVGRRYSGKLQPGRYLILKYNKSH